MELNEYLMARQAAGRRLRDLRESCDITLNSLSFKTGISISSLSRNENGQREILLSEFTKICVVMGMHGATSRGASRLPEIMHIIEGFFIDSDGFLDRYIDEISVMYHEYLPA